MNLIAIHKANEEDLPISRATAYRWHSERKYPKLIFKLCGKVFFNLDQWNAMAKAKIEAEEKAMARMKSLRQ